MSQLDTLTVLCESIRRLGLSDGLDATLEHVLEQAERLVGFDHGALMLYDPASGALTVRKVRGYGEEASQILGLRLERGRGLSGWAAENHAAARINDVTSDDRYVRGLREARSNLAVPLMVDDQVTGVFSVESKAADAFTEEHEKLLTILGAQAALAILAVRAQRRQRNQIEQLDVLYRISQLASQDDGLELTLEAILETTEALLPDGHVAVLLVDESTRSLVVRAARNYVRAEEEARIPIGQGVTGRCAQSGEVILVQDLEAHDEYIPGIEGARSELAVPLKVDGRVIGVLNVESRIPHAYQVDHVRTLSVVAQQAAAVIRAAQGYEEARRLAATDPLTALHNRRHFMETLDEQLARVKRYGEKLALLVVDCDGLKAINDRYGHEVGDRALRAVADTMRNALRSTDEIARVGGDEFAALLLHAGDGEARIVAKRLQRFIKGLQLIGDDGDPISISVSTGVALVPDDGTEATALLKIADRAMYRAKETGAGRVVFVSDNGRPGSEPSRPDHGPADAEDGRAAWGDDAAPPQGGPDEADQHGVPPAPRLGLETPGAVDPE